VIEFEASAALAVQTVTYEQLDRADGRQQRATDRPPDA
jgi:hypothetical protein